MPKAIDFLFLSNLEGGSTTTGYVPDPGGSKSGVTIATGFDLGARLEPDLYALKLKPEIIEKLIPYLGLQSYDAIAQLEKHPLEVSEEEAKAIDEASHSSHADSIAKLYDEATPEGIAFYELPSEAQTVIASVAFQYGTNLPKRTPNFWALLTRQDWPAAVNELNDFGDKYPTRRKKEADLLQIIV